MAIISSFPFGKQVCEILGLDPKIIRDIKIEIHPDDAILITTTRFLRDTEAPKLLEVLEKYELIPKNDTNANDTELPKS